MSLKKAANRKAADKNGHKSAKNSRSKLTLMNLKVTSKDRELLLSRAKKYTDGNVSAWLRRAGLKYRPS